MNNGRDCPHGRQVGKCDTCDLIKTELELERVTAERDALAVTLSIYEKLMDELVTTDGLICSISRWYYSERYEELSDATPQTHLAAHDAEVAAKSVLEFSAKLLVNQKVDVIDCAKVEADQLRAKSKR